MASGFFAVLDDIASLMDDVAVTTKVAATKTTGILGDDLAVNAEKATGFVASRELPVLWAITKGSLLNKLIIVPIALLLNAFFPAIIPIVLVLGGFYLAYEGVEKIIEFFFHKGRTAPEVKEESAKVKAAITTDFILSIEIVIIALGTVLDEPLLVQIITVALVAILATIGVYGIVALIVRMDDAGYSLIKSSKNKGLLFALGNVLVKALPLVIKLLGIVGTVALILVAGGIFLHHAEHLLQLFPHLPSFIMELLLGLIGGLLVFAIVRLGHYFRGERN
ncbi:DUF808 domain-containing protein [Mucilaginibacter corticis]|uniref:DUF808 domain-containing protein n=1 Tax=Mucilaginibacter corticis TaxID=2597670 RepID=A0A556M7N4_9SPHI|nr:DUF808 family protein [Mucilaginibacter corticis]TSJ35897.1 DUF808 domain-containing protein [Mucilaginibacter corticis]